MTDGWSDIHKMFAFSPRSICIQIQMIYMFDLQNQKQELGGVGCKLTPKVWMYVCLGIA